MLLSTGSRAHLRCTSQLSGRKDPGLSAARRECQRWLWRQRQENRTSPISDLLTLGSLQILLMILLAVLWNRTSLEEWHGAA